MSNNRRDWLRQATMLSAAGLVGLQSQNVYAQRDPRWNEATTKGLKWLSRTQSSRVVSGTLKLIRPRWLHWLVRR